MEYSKFAKIKYIIDPQSFKIEKKINSNKKNSITFNGNFEFLNI